MGKKEYPSNLTHEQWARIEPRLPAAKAMGRPRKVDLRDVVNGVLYLNRAGCSWRMLPHDFPPWQTVYDYFCRFRRDGTWDHIHDALRQEVRVAVGKEPTPSAAILDSQSVKTAEKGGTAVMTRERRSRVGNDIS